jgi:hypothetical protein
MTVVMLWAWRQRCGNWWFASYMLLLGCAFGYIIPGIGTNVLKLWRFHGPFKIGNYFIHHGLMYAPYLALSLYCTFGIWEKLTAGRVITIVFCTAFVQAVLSCHHDYCGLSAGVIEIFNRPGRQGKDPLEIILDYGPVGFGLFGATYAVSCLAAYHYFIIRQQQTIGIMLLLLAGGVTLMGLASIPYLIHERDYIRSTFRLRRSLGR